MRTLTWILSVSVLIAACGGGGGGNNTGGGAGQPPPPPTTLSGRFKDSNVQGLGFSTASQSGTTDQLGRFSYVSGESIEFSVGNVVIGSTQGGPTITPIDLVTGGASNDTTVENIVRFLIMLDTNENPLDGIDISGPVRTAAANWAQPDFASPTFANDIVTIVSDVASVDNRAASLPSAQQARNHLNATERCLMSGLFSGRMSGSISGDIYVLVYPGNGKIKAAYRSSQVNFESAEPTPIDRQREFLLVSNGNASDSFEGRFDSYDELSGVYTVGTDTGAFVATRELADPDAIWRYTGEWYLNSVGARLDGLHVFNVESNGAWVGTGPQVVGNRYETTGMIDGDQITSVVHATTLTGTVDEDLNVSMTGMNSGGETVLSFAKGCRLN